MRDIVSPTTPPVTSPRRLTAHAAAAGKNMAATKTAREFEAVFIGQMTQMMMETATPEGEFSGGHGESMFRGVMAEKLGAAIAQRGGIGLAPMVLDQIIKLQGGPA